MGGLEVRVLGTRFNASHIPDLGIEEVTLLSGSVEVRHDRFPRDGAAPPPTRAAPTTRCRGGWPSKRQGQQLRRLDTGDSIVFDNMTLEDIAVNLEHWYNIRIRIDDSVDASTRISFPLRPETLDETLRPSSRT